MSLSDLAAIGSLASGRRGARVADLPVAANPAGLEKSAGADEPGRHHACGGHTFGAVRLSVPRTKMNEGCTDFSALEIDQLGMALRVMLLNSQDIWTQQRSGLVDQMIFNNAIGAMRRIFSQPVYRARWLDQRGSFDPDWVAFVDRQIEETPLAPPVETVSHYEGGEEIGQNHRLGCERQRSSNLQGERAARPRSAEKLERAAAFVVEQLAGRRRA